MTDQNANVTNVSHWPRWFSDVVIFSAGAFVGVALTMFGMQLFPNNGTTPAIRVKPAEMVLVVQTATPLPVAGTKRIDNELVMPEPTVLPIVGVSETLKGAASYAQLGKANAPVQLVVFADPQCPFCRKQAIETEPQLIEQYVRSGKASITYRHFAFLGEESQRIATAMACAGEQGQEAFWKFHDYVFAHQFPENSGLATNEALIAWANAVHLDEKAFSTCTANGNARSQVDADTEAGRALGVTGTPTLFVNGRPMPGALPFDFIKTAIEAQLKR